MEKYFYLVATPESLIASHLSPEEFGNYMATGTKKNLRSQSIYFEIDPEKCSLPINYVNHRLVPYANGEPKRSVYLSIYRVYEQIPLKALKNLYLATDDGKVMKLSARKYNMPRPQIHLYQQFNPISTMVASKLNPPEFMRFLTDTKKPVSTPKLFFAELQLNELGTDPSAPLKNLPYRNPAHLRECISKLHDSNERLTKTVLRYRKSDLHYRTIKDGFFIGDIDHYLFFPFPKQEELESTYFSWWKSALVQHI